MGQICLHEDGNITSVFPLPSAPQRGGTGTLGAFRPSANCTTVPKAKAIAPMVEKMITLAKRDTLHTRRQAAGFLTTPASVKKLFDTLGTSFGQRNGGYTRITRLGPRKGDGAELAMLELVGSELVKRADERAKRKRQISRLQRLPLTLIICRSS
jgi:ribosomal protein L17